MIHMKLFDRHHRGGCGIRAVAVREDRGRPEKYCILPSVPTAASETPPSAPYCWRALEWLCWRWSVVPEDCDWMGLWAFSLWTPLGRHGIDLSDITTTARAVSLPGYDSTFCCNFRHDWPRNVKSHFFLVKEECYELPPHYFGYIYFL